MKKVILADGTVLTPESVELGPAIVIQAADRAAFLSIWDQLDPQNIDQVDLYDNDILLARYRACELIGTQTVNNYDGSMLAHFYLEGQPVQTVDATYEEAYRILTEGE